LNEAPAALTDSAAATVFEACREEGVAVEINCRPERSDPPDRLLKLAAETGCVFAIDTDAHAPGQLDWLDSGCARTGRRLDLSQVWVDEQADLQARGAAADDCLAHPCKLAGNVESALGRQLGPPLGDERHLVGPHRERNGHDLRRDGRLEVEPNANRFAQQAQVAVLNVAAIFAQMNRDSIGPAQLGQRRGPNRVRLAPTARLAQRGDVIDIHTETRHRENLRKYDFASETKTEQKRLHIRRDSRDRRESDRMEHNELSKVENAEIRFHRRDRRERGDEDRVEEGASTQRQQRSPRMKNNEFSRVHNPSSNLRPCRAARVTGLMDV